MPKKMVDWLSVAVPFLEAYPVWVKTSVALWLVFSAVILVMLLFFRGTPEDRVSQTRIGEPFAAVYTSYFRVAERLGKPTGPYRDTKLSIQFFQKGIMIWREDRWKIYTLLRSPDRWKVFADLAGPEGTTYEDMPAGRNAPEGLFPPGGGFLRVWVKERVGDEVGWALDPLRFHNLAGGVQDFKAGIIMGPLPNSPNLRLSSQWVYVLYGDGESPSYEYFAY